MITITKVSSHLPKKKKKIKQRKKNKEGRAPFKESNPHNNRKHFKV